MSRVFSLSIMLLASVAGAQELPTDFVQEPVLSGLTAPTSFRFLPDDRILVCEQTSGEIRLFIDGLPATNDPLVVVPDVNTLGSERGLLSIEVDPQWPARPFVYSYYNYNGQSEQDTRLTRFTVTGDLDGSGNGELDIDAASALHIVTGIVDQASNHNGGDVRFGTDGTLYMSTGDDEGNRCLAQDVTQLVGKILRLRVDHLGASRTGSVALSELAPTDGLNPFPGQGDTAALVWAYGMRNPVRFSVDSQDGSIFVCDVGKDTWEEIDHVETGGVNLGWPHREADAVYNVGVEDCFPEPDPFIYQSPIDAYAHSAWGGSSLSIMGGVVYRPTGGLPGSWPSEYTGDVFYAEFYRVWLRRLDGSGQNYTRQPPFVGDASDQLWASSVGNGGLVDFAVGSDDSLYFLSLIGGTLWRVRYTGGTPTAGSSIGKLKSSFEGG
jgi:glucose/arabinose dehydrogenase